MTRQPAASARALVRGFALLGGLFVLLGGVSCSRETFDLLDAPPSPGFGGASGASGGTAPGGRTGSGGLDRDGGTSKAGANSGKGGGFPSLGGSGGSGGPTDFGMAGEPPCLPGESCVDGGVSCPPTVSVCRRCTGDSDCGHDEPYCAIADGRCVECLPSKDNCRAGYSCDPTFLRCAQSCLANPDCGDNHQVCAVSRGVCVDCRFSSECQALPGHESYTCIAGFCVECGEDINCPNPAKPVCQQFHCVAKQ